MPTSPEKRASPDQDESETQIIANSKKQRSDMDEESEIDDGGIFTCPPFFEVLITEPQRIIPLLTSREACALLASCSEAGNLVVLDSIGGHAFPLYYEEKDVHADDRCYGNWHQLVLRPVRRMLPGCGCTRLSSKAGILQAKPTFYSLPGLTRARMHLLEAIDLVYEGIRPHCFKILDIPTMSMKDSWPTGVMQPVAFSLAAVLEVDKKGKTTNQAMTVDADNIEELTRLINFVEPELGFRFFSSRNERREPLNAVEAHWRGIKVHQGTGETSCSFCTDFERSSMYKFLRQYEDSEAYLLGHCSEIYQPLKKFMLQHLKHVRYVRPARGWNDGDVRGSSSKRQFQDLIAGFTPAGVLCGVYVRARDAKSE